MAALAGVLLLLAVLDHFQERGAVALGIGTGWSAFVRVLVLADDAPLVEVDGGVMGEEEFRGNARHAENPVRS